jgi:hypothetical protein
MIFCCEKEGDRLYGTFSASIGRFTRKSIPDNGN